MKEQLIQYVNLLFAGSPDCEDMKQEILQNTLDRYDDLISQGKSPQAAYHLAITGIGDISEILGNTSTGSAPPQPTGFQAPVEEDDPKRKKLRALAIMLYIICAIPLFVLSDLGLETIGLALTIVIAAVATYLILVTGKKDVDEEEKPETEKHESDIKKSIDSLIGAITLAVYLIVSFVTGAWYITWLIFPISGCVQGLINAILDLKEATKHES